MKAVMLIFAPALEDEVMQAIKISGVKKYSKIPYMHGAGGHSDPHLDTQVWPGSNEALLIMTDEGTKTKLLKAAADIKQSSPEEGMKAFVWTVEEEV